MKTKIALALLSFAALGAAHAESEDIASGRIISTRTIAEVRAEAAQANVHRVASYRSDDILFGDVPSARPVRTRAEVKDELLEARSKGLPAPRGEAG